MAGGNLLTPYLQWGQGYWGNCLCLCFLLNMLMVLIFITQLLTFSPLDSLCEDPGSKVLAGIWFLQADLAHWVLSLQSFVVPRLWFAVHDVKYLHEEIGQCQYWAGPQSQKPQSPVKAALMILSAFSPLTEADRGASLRVPCCLWEMNSQPNCLRLVIV